MSAQFHPLAPHYLPSFVALPGETDTMFVAVAVFFIGMVLIVGNLYLRLHALPERMAHRSNRSQFQIVAVLALIALFTHQMGFWIAALILALIPLPDVVTPIRQIANQMEQLVRIAARPGFATETRLDDPAAGVTEAAGDAGPRPPVSPS